MKVFPQVKYDEMGENGWLGEIVVYKPTDEVGVVEGVVESWTGWTTELTARLGNGVTRKGKPEDFKEADGNQRAVFFDKS